MKRYQRVIAQTKMTWCILPLGIVDKHGFPLKSGQNVADNLQGQSLQKIYQRVITPAKITKPQQASLTPRKIIQTQDGNYMGI